ncbi:MAG: P-type conjugative transfer protein TrbG [Synergistaceae bacterium]|jgi:type IV secretion system protein VirB9|nr:P-type conjugative transfer protein TrbG [Synergistaceae bacterium]
MKRSVLAFVSALAFALCHAMFSPASGECSVTWNAVSEDFKAAVENRREETKAEPESEMVEIEYGGKIISVDIADLILMAGEDGGQKVELGDPEKYAEQYENAVRYGEGRLHANAEAEAEAEAEFEGGSDPAENNLYGQGPNVREITEREYEEERRARQWADIVEDLNLREIDEKALALVKEFHEAKGTVPPSTGVSGSVVVAYSSYTPKIVCRPMYVTDVILQPGENVTGLHPGDPVRWTFAPSVSGSGVSLQVHVLIKPLMADISTNLIVNTDRRTYQLDLMSSATDFMPSVLFSYPADSLKEWDVFLADRKKERESNAALASGYTISPEDLHLEYEIRGKDSLRWKPIRVWDDEVKTYIQFKRGSMRQSVEAPVLVVFEHKKEVLVNYRAGVDMYIVDRVFDKAALIVGTGSRQDRVVITRLKRGI